MAANATFVSATACSYSFTVRKDDDGMTPPDAGNSNTSLCPGENTAVLQNRGDYFT